MSEGAPKDNLAGPYLDGDLGCVCTQRACGMEALTSRGRDPVRDVGGMLPRRLLIEAKPSPGTWGRAWALGAPHGLAGQEKGCFNDLRLNDTPYFAAIILSCLYGRDKVERERGRSPRRATTCTYSFLSVRRSGAQVRAVRLLTVRHLKFASLYSTFRMGVRTPYSISIH